MPERRRDRSSRSSTSSASIVGTIANTPFACSTVRPQSVATSAPQPACHLWASGDLGAECHLGGGWLSLVGPSEGLAAGVDALGSVVGKQSYQNTLALFRDLSSRINLDAIPLITTDGFKFYERVIDGRLGQRVSMAK